MELLFLRHEFGHGEGSFLAQLRPGFVWDPDAFCRLANAMEDYCRTRPGDETSVDRWLARGFWFVPRYTRTWTGHPNFPRAYPGAYYEKAYRRLDDLSYLFFMDSSPYSADHIWDPVRP